VGGDRGAGREPILALCSTSSPLLGVLNQKLFALGDCEACDQLVEGSPRWVSVTSKSLNADETLSDSQIGYTMLDKLDPTLLRRGVGVAAQAFGEGEVNRSAVYPTGATPVGDLSGQDQV
jgi:hypothetical protein